MNNDNRINTMFDADTLKKEELMAQGRTLHDQAIGKFILGLFTDNTAESEKSGQPGVITVFDIQNRTALQAGSAAV